MTVEAWPAAEFHPGDLVELSWLGRRGDRAAPHGALYAVGTPAVVPEGVKLPLSRNGSGVTAPQAGCRGWSSGAGTGRSRPPGSRRTRPTARGVREGHAGAGSFEIGDWWGVSVREAEGGVERRKDALSDGTQHVFAPLALVDLDARIVLDARPKFNSLLEGGNGTCTVTVYPGDDLQDAINSLPVGGGELSSRPARSTCARR